ncbi:heterokaryon incompatibility protein [Paraphaeosphaeria sporulosa]
MLTKLAHLIPQDVPEPTRSVNSGTRLLDWYQNCLQNHPDCQSIFDATHRPTRLLDIGKSYLEPVRLVTFSTEDPQTSGPIYATLSHCWGVSQPLRLLSSNLSQFQAGIARESLPRVFTEAIEVCWHLGIQYLWIDSLCILQDLVEDWSRESQHMGSIYSRAMINIGATGSNGCNDKLFSSADEAPSVGLISWGGSNAKYVVVENPLEWAKSFMNQPLLQRAWVMQERFLATRMVHFTKSQVVWECRTTAATETYPIRVPDSLWSFHDRRNRFWREDFIEDDSVWSALVAAYSRCELTFGRDKLIALSGLVSALETTGLSRGRYWAGLWDADLPYCLTWRRAAIDPSKWSSARPDTYRAPSWSWASLDYPVWTDWGAAGASESAIVSHWEVKEEKGPSSAASLLLYHPLSLHLNGPLVRAAVQVKRPWVEAIGRGIERVQGISYSIARIDDTIALHDDAWNDVVFDDFNDENLRQEIWCAPIYECAEWVENADDEERLLGLLLEEVDHGTYRRLGAFSVGSWADRVALKGGRERAYRIV